MKIQNSITDLAALVVQKQKRQVPCQISQISLPAPEMLSTCLQLKIVFEHVFFTLFSKLWLFFSCLFVFPFITYTDCRLMLRSKFWGLGREMCMYTYIFTSPTLLTQELPELGKTSEEKQAKWTNSLSLPITRLISRSYGPSQLVAVLTKQWDFMALEWLEYHLPTPKMYHESDNCAGKDSDSG